MSAKFPTDAEREVAHDAGLAVCDCHDYPEAERTSAVLSALQPLVAAREAAARRGGAVEAVESLRRFARAQDTWCDAGRAEQVITRRAMRDALLREANRIEADDDRA